MADGGGNCEEVLRQVEAYLDDELATSIRVEVEQHLGDCPPCMERAEFRKHLKLVISTKCSGDRMPAELREKLARLIHDTPTV